jgi:hypothetical protein
MSKMPVTDSVPPAAESSDVEARRMREALEDVLVILGDPAGYCENDRTEIAQAVARIERALGRRPEPSWHALPSPVAGDR